MPAKDILKAHLEYQDGRERILTLRQIEPTVFRWLADNGQPWDGTDYVDRATAVSQLRVEVDQDKQTYKDLTVLAIEPGPAERAAERVDLYFDGQGDPVQVGEISSIINEVTNIEKLSDSISTLVTYIFRHRPQFAKALFPVTEAGAPRDLTLDGLLLDVVQAMEKTTGQNYENLRKILMEPVQTIQLASKMPPKGRVQ